MKTELEKKLEKLAKKGREELEKLFSGKLHIMNEQIAKIDDRYKGMMSHLVSVFLVKLEKRVYENSVAVISLQQLMIENYAAMMKITYEEAKELLEDKFANVAEKIIAEDKKEQDDLNKESKDESEK